jgi:hypothetical protein
MYKRANFKREREVLLEKEATPETKESKETWDQREIRADL